MNPNQPSIDIVTIVAWGEDWLTTKIYTNEQMNPSIFWVSLPKDIQTKYLDNMILKIKKDNPKGTFLDTGITVKLPDNYTQIIPEQDFDKRLIKLYTKYFNDEDNKETT